MLAHLNTRAPLEEANSALKVHCVPVSGRIVDLVDYDLGETTIAEAQGRNSMGGADCTLYRADLAYAKLGNLCGIIFFESIDCGGPCLL